jgi:predicted AAA+ superfamily ATPase
VCGVVIDEIQHAPNLFSSLLVAVDRHHHYGQNLITGSQHFLVSERIAQFLAERVSIFIRCLFPWLNYVQRISGSTIGNRIRCRADIHAIG